MGRQIDVALAARLFHTALEMERQIPDLVERRQRILSAVAELIDADLGHWAWGRGYPDHNQVTPVAVLTHGFSMEQASLMIQMGTDREAETSFRARIMKRLRGNMQMASLPRDIYAQDEWHSSKLYRRYIAPMGVDSFVNCVRYPQPDTWCYLMFFRRAGRKEFGEQEVALVDLALAGITWLGPQIPETIPAERFVGLTPRQRAVLLMQLDGLSRKQIATNLEITEQTVGDHLKALYKHFDVHSASELAARFLRGA